MLERGINARKLAIEANLGASFVYDLLSGKSVNPTFSRIKSIAAVLNVSPSYILSDDNIQNADLITIKYEPVE